MDTLLRQVQARTEAEHERVGQSLRLYSEVVGSTPAPAPPPSLGPLLNVELYFYEPRPDDYAINRAVAFLTREKVGCVQSSAKLYGFAHVELCFSYNPYDGTRLRGQNYSFSIAQGTNVYLRYRERWRNEYVAVAFPVSMHQYRALWERCLALSSLQPPIGFDKLGMYLALFAPASLLMRRVDEVHGTFCSKIVLRVLQECQVYAEDLAGLHPSTATPTQLFLALQTRCIPTARVG